MFDYINIADIEILKDKIPSEFQFWHCFGNILELNYSSKAIDGFYCDYTQIQSLEEYFRLMQAIDTLSPDARTPIRLAVSDGIETFSAPVFAAYCSRNALMCLKRLAQYKPLIGALLYQVEETDTEVSVEILSDNAELELPEILVGIEFVFLVGLIRKATKEHITPLSVTIKHPIKNPAYVDYVEIPIATGTKINLYFPRQMHRFHSSAATNPCGSFLSLS